MDGSFANQVLAQIHLYGAKFAALPAAEKQARITVEVLPKKLDEMVARLHLNKLGVKLDRLSKHQAEYLGVPVNGPYKPNHYRY